MEIKLSNGTATISEIITRKTQKEYKAKLFANIKVRQSMDPEDLELDLIQAEDANDSLVLNMIQNLKIDNKEVSVTCVTVEELCDDDFNLILNECLKIFNKNHEEKKT